MDRAVSKLSRNVAPAILAAVFVLTGSVARGGIAPPRPGTIRAEDVDLENFRAEDIFSIRFPEKMRIDPRMLAKCRTCGQPLKDHLDGEFVCQIPGRRVATLGKARTRCPVCALEFKAPKPDPDPRGGVDKDFCRHPRGVYALASEICLCPKCGYATPFDEFTKPVDEKTREFVRSTVTPGTKKFLEALVGFKPKSFKFKDFGFLDPAYIPEHFKYENALAVAGAHLSDAKGAAPSGGSDDLAIARLHLGASHAYRRLVNRPFREAGLDRAIRRVERMLVDPLAIGESDPVAVATAARRVLKRADAKKALPSEKLRRRERLYLLMRLTGLHDRLGEPWWADYHLRQAWALATKEEEPRVKRAYTGLVRNMVEFLRREAHHRGRAVARYRRALGSGETPPKERLVSTYMVGELLARMGNLKKARPWLEEAVRYAASSEGAGEAASLIVSWARSRLNSPAFHVGEGAGRRLIDADPEEKAFVTRMAAGLPVELSSDTPSAAPAASRGESPASEPGANAAPPGESTNARDRALPPSIVSTKGTQAESRAKSPAPAPDPAPANCHEQMERIWRAVDAYSRARGDFPPKLTALIKAGLVSRKEIGDFTCVDSKAELFYRAPRAGGSTTFMVFHSGPGSCSCKNLLLSDGQIVEFGKWQP